MDKANTSKISWSSYIIKNLWTEIKSLIQEFDRENNRREDVENHHNLLKSSLFNPIIQDVFL